MISPGTANCKEEVPVTPAAAACALVIALIVIGTSCNRCSRRCAVTTISPIDPSSLAALGGVATSDTVEATCAYAGATVSATSIETPLSKRSEEHTSELQSIMHISYTVF